MNKNLLLIVIAVLVVVALGSAMLLTTGKNEMKDNGQGEDPVIKDGENTDEDVPPKIELSENELKLIDDEILKCADEVLELSLSLSGRNGGYFSEPQSYVETFYLAKIPVYLNGSNKMIPTLDQIQKEVSEEFNPLFRECVQNYERIEYGQAFIFFEDYNTKITIDTEGEKLETSFNIKLDADGYNQTISSASGESEINFAKKFEIVKGFVDLHSTENDRVPMSDLVTYAYEKGFTFDYGESDQTGMGIYDLIFKDGFEFSFAIQYNKLEGMSDSTSDVSFDGGDNFRELHEVGSSGSSYKIETGQGNEIFVFDNGVLSKDAYSEFKQFDDVRGVTLTFEDSDGNIQIVTVEEDEKGRYRRVIAVADSVEGLTTDEIREKVESEEFRTIATSVDNSLEKFKKGYEPWEG